MSPFTPLMHFSPPQIPLPCFLAYVPVSGDICVSIRLSSRTVPSWEVPGRSWDRTGQNLETLKVPWACGPVVPELKKSKSPVPFFPFILRLEINKWVLIRLCRVFFSPKNNKICTIIWQVRVCFSSYTVLCWATQATACVVT